VERHNSATTQFRRLIIIRHPPCDLQEKVRADENEQSLLLRTEEVLNE
jgi:hypothetical protein